MFDVGFWELALIGVVALVIIGPERLPGAAHTAGLWVEKGRRMLRDAKSDIDRELREQNIADLAALKKDVLSAGEELRQSTEAATEAARTPFEEVAKSVASVGDDEDHETKTKTKAKTTTNKTKHPKNTALKNKTPKTKANKTNAQGNQEKGYWMYVNRVHKTAKIHLAECAHCNHGEGQKQSGPSPSRERDEWHGPHSLADIRQKQKEINSKTKSDCGICMKRKV